MLEEYYPVNNINRCRMFLDGLYNRRERTLSNSVKTQLTEHVALVKDKLHDLANVVEGGNQVIIGRVLYKIYNETCVKI